MMPVPEPPPVILPLLVMPPPKLDSAEEPPVPPTRMPSTAAVIVPLLLSPPETFALLVMTIPRPEAAVIVPALLTVPLTVLLLMMMPVFDGEAPPFGVRTPVLVLVTLPETLALFSTRIRLPVAELLLTEAVDPPFWMTLQFGPTARAGGAPPPTSSAATELDASNRQSLPRS